MFKKTDNPPPIDIIHVLVRTTQHIQREFSAQLSKLDLPYSVTGPRLRLLSVVADSGPIRMSELADRMNIKARTVTDFVDALEREKLLIRVPDPTDRRATLIELTDLSRDHLSETLAYRDGIANKMLANLSEEQRNQFYGLLLRIIEDEDLSNPDRDVLI